MLIRSVSSRETLIIVPLGRRYLAYISMSTLCGMFIVTSGEKFFTSSFFVVFIHPMSGLIGPTIFSFYRVELFPTLAILPT